MKIRLVLLFMLATLTLVAQDFNRAKLDSLFMLIHENEKGMGSVSIFYSGREVYRNSVGYASVEDNIPATAGTKYRVGSVSKIFTATLIMQLVEEGKLSLDDKIDTYFPDIENAREITVEHLLRHRSGIFNFTSAGSYTSWMEKEVSRSQLLDSIRIYGAVFEPGKKMEYSNSNYVLLSFIIEKETGRSLKEVVRQRIAIPCQLKDTYYGGVVDPTKNEAHSYTRMNRWEHATETHMSVPIGAGAIVSTPTDVNTFLTCLFEGKLVKQETVVQMRQMKDNYGLGLFPAPFYGKTAFGHTGGIDGFQSSAFYFPEEKVAVTYLGNGISMPVNDILIGILSIYFGRDYELPVFTKAMELSSEQLKKYTGVYSSPAFPLKVTISVKEDILIGQATGQPSFPLEAYALNKFKYDAAGLKLEFLPLQNKMILRQGGGEFELTKE